MVLLGEFWSQKAFSTGVIEARGKELRRDGFTRAQERYSKYPNICPPNIFILSAVSIAEYKPILKEVERMLAEAGLDEEEIRRSSTSGGPDAGGQSRNRR